MAEQAQRASERLLGLSESGCKDGEQDAVGSWTQANDGQRGAVGLRTAVLLPTDEEVKGAPRIPCRVLVVDDWEEHAKTMLDLAKYLGWRGEWAKSGDEALWLLLHQHFDVCVLHHKLGAEDGLRLLPTLRTYAPHLQVIMCSGFAQCGETGARAVQLGAVGFLDKPIPLHRLAESLAAAMGRTNGIPESGVKLEVRARHSALDARLSPSVDRVIAILERRLGFKTGVMEIGRALLVCENPAAKPAKEECRAAHDRIAERFRTVTGVTPVEYAGELRLAMAAWLIRRRDRKLGSVSTQCGFNHYYSFARAFTRRFGLSPSRARGRWQREAARHDGPQAVGLVPPPPATATPVDPRSVKRPWTDMVGKPGVPLPLPLGQANVTSGKARRDQIFS